MNPVFDSNEINSFTSLILTDVSNAKTFTLHAKSKPKYTMDISNRRSQTIKQPEVIHFTSFPNYDLYNLLSCSKNELLK